MLAELRLRLQALQRPAGLDDEPGRLPLGIDAIDAALGGGLLRGALHEIAAAGEAHCAAATGFAVAVASLSSPLPWGEVGVRSAPGEGLQPNESHLSPHPNPLSPGERESGRVRRTVVWIVEDMALAESGALYGPGLMPFARAPESLLAVAAAHRRDLLWAMEEALRCRAVDAVIGDVRHGALDMVVVRRLSLAAAESGALALLVRAAPAADASTAATRWIVGAAPGGEAHARFSARLVRNRRGPVGAWTLDWSDKDERFLLATHAQPVAAPVVDRPHRQVA